MVLRDLATAAAFILCLIGFSQQISAQEAATAERQSVLQRARPDYDPLGLRAGSFLLFPSMNAQETYDSNVFVTETNRKSDFVTTVDPGFQLRSDWTNNALNFAASGDIKRYATQVGENNSNFRTALDGRLDIERGIYVTSGLSYALLHEDRGSPNTVTNEKNPTEYQLATANAGYVHDTGRLALQVDGNVADYSYNNAVTSTGVTIPESDRNRIEYVAGPSLSYEIIPGYHATLKGRVNYRDYASEFDASGFDRTSHGYEVDTGTAIRLGATINGELFVGYFTQDYNDRRLATASGPSFGGDLLWNVTQLLSLRASLTRTVEETTVAPASTYVQTAFNVSAERELRRNLLLDIGANYIVQDFQGITRTDQNYGGNVDLRYLINRNLSADVGANYSHRLSDAPDLEYSRYMVSASIRLQY